MSATEFRFRNYLSKSPLLKGLLFTLAISFFLIFLLTILLQITNLSESYLQLIGPLVLVVSVAVGGASAAKASEARFLLNGLGVGMLYLVLTAIISIVGGSSIGIAALGTKLLYCAGAGIMGGMLGAFLKQT